MGSRVKKFHGDIYRGNGKKLQATICGVGPMENGEDCGGMFRGIYIYMVTPPTLYGNIYIYIHLHVDFFGVI